jgi:hypothetical protein
MYFYIELMLKLLLVYYYIELMLKLLLIYYMYIYI